MSTERERTPESLFEGRPTNLRLFQTIRQHIESLGPVKVTTSKTQVAFAVNRQFAWMWMVAPSRSMPEGTLMLTLDLRRQVDHPLIRNVNVTGRNKWTHQISVVDESVAEQVIASGWIEEAYRFGTE